MSANCAAYVSHDITMARLAQHAVIIDCRRFSTAQYCLRAVVGSAAERGQKFGRA